LHELVAHPPIQAARHAAVNGEIERRGDGPPAVLFDDPARHPA
jgi:hypothetical protein